VEVSEDQMAGKSNRSEIVSRNLLRLGALAAIVAISLPVFFDYGHRHVFDPVDLQELAKRGIEQGKGNSTLVISGVTELVKKRYGDHIFDSPRWMFNNAGGAMGTMLVLHCSLSEYLIIFGTPLGTEGHTGRFMADDFFTMIVGEQWAALSNAPQREVYGPGEQHHLPRGVSKQYRCPGECWALEYARGSIVSMLPFGFADTFTSTLDFVSLWETILVSAEGIVRELLRGKV